MSSVVIVPGLHNSGPRHWQTLWQRRLPNAVRVEQDDWAVPNLTRWAANVAAVLNAVDDCWIVAHSFGCLASVQALAQAPGKVRGLLLVAPADPDKFSVAAQLPAQPLAINGRIIASRTDPWLSWTKAQQWAQRWQLPISCAGDAGHINAESGHGFWAEGWQVLQQMQQMQQLRRATRPRYLALAV